MKNQYNEITLECFESNYMSVQSCNFNLKGDLILFCTNARDVNIVFVYSMQTETQAIKCQNIYMVPKEAELISISKHDRIWLRFNDYIYEWNLRDSNTTIVSNNISGVIINQKLFYYIVNFLAM